MHIHLVSPEQNWILAKITGKIQQHASGDGIEITVSGTQDQNADINQYINWFQFVGKPKTRYDLLYFTHVNKGEDNLVLDTIARADHTTTMSTWEREKLMGMGVPGDKLTVVLPGMDGDWQPRPLRLGIACRYYPDGRREDWLLYELAKRGALEGFELWVLGSGWEPVLAKLKTMGVKSVHFPGSGDYIADYDVHHRIIPQLDYLFHPGLDSTLGIMDAMASGVRVICWESSFALDFAGADSAFFFQNVDGAELILRAIMYRHRQVGEKCRARTWEAMGRDMAALYRKLLGGEDGSELSGVQGTEVLH